MIVSRCSHINVAGVVMHIQTPDLRTWYLGGCGSCWAFSATEVIESAVAIATGKLLTLAPQQMVSCAPNPDDCGGTGGCQGSVQWLGFNYTKSAGGLSLETDYPYMGTTGTCKTSAIKPAAGVKGYVRLPANNYTALMNAVATIGPISISVDASWMDYEKGVYSGPCGTTIDHAVVLVGYGTEQGKDYYLVRNRCAPLFVTAVPPWPQQLCFLATGLLPRVSTNVGMIHQFALV